MGCDAHLFVEMNFNDRWEHYGEIEVYRDYEFFGVLAKGHLRSSHKGIFKIKGLPDNINPVTQTKLDRVAEHTHSYLESKQLNILHAWLIENDIQYELKQRLDDLLETYFDESFTKPSLKDGFKGIRLVFGFDN